MSPMRWTQEVHEVTRMSDLNVTPDLAEEILITEDEQESDA